MQRPGPLQELPLEAFLLPAPSSLKPIKLSKRPHSPGGPTPFSPAKRRILSEEGIFSSEMTSKSPLPRGKDAFASPARFSKVLAGPASPARVLDFGLPKNGGGDPQKRSAVHSMTTRNASSSQISSSSSSRSGLAPSPELKPRSTRTPAVTSESQSGMNSFDELSSLSLSPLPASLTFVPRELPPQADPRSIHYPGFSVFQDSHTIIYPSAQTDELPASSSDDMEVDVDIYKENQPPRRKIRKAATEPTKSTKADLSSPGGTSLKKSYSANDTPRITMAWNGGGQARSVRSPSLTPQNHLYRGMRQLMKDELEVGEGQSGGDDY
ncbi:hypothetical protein BJ912DRAFT_9122 [Pholiota molesta]|nr:hypothetical protein BJ912DRAFT_9122 [Pholiota molesta]